MVLRYLPLFVLLAACDLGDAPSLQLGVDDANTLTITFERGDDHVFGPLSATANGIDCGPPAIIAGHTGYHDPNPASATFTISMAQLGAGVDVVVTEDRDTYEVASPTLGTPRTVQILTSLAAPLGRGDWIEATTGVAGDQLTGAFDLMQGQTYCLLGPYGVDIRTDSVALQMPTDPVAVDWTCGDVSAGSVVQTELSLFLDVDPELTTCNGDALTCTVSALGPTIDTPIQVQF